MLHPWLERWIQSRDALQQFLNIRQQDSMCSYSAEQGFIESEQALILGHSMHPGTEKPNRFCP